MFCLLIILLKCFYETCRYYFHGKIIIDNEFVIEWEVLIKNKRFAPGLQLDSTEHCVRYGSILGQKATNT